MRVELRDFLTDAEIDTLWKMAGRIIDSGAIIDDSNYEISLSLTVPDKSINSKPVQKVAHQAVHEHP